jgi:hypothetical protein
MNKRGLLGVEPTATTEQRLSNASMRPGRHAESAEITWDRFRRAKVQVKVELGSKA